MTRHFVMLFTGAILCAMTTSIAKTKSSNNQRIISFGTMLNPQTAIKEARQLAASLADPTSQQWQTKGDQRRKYNFPDANTDIPYRICVPETWDGTSELPLVMYLHGAGSDENMYLDMNNGQLIQITDEYGFLLVSPLGYQGAYGNYLRLSAPFGNPAGTEQLMAQVTGSKERDNRLSEQDVLNVLELILNEYPIDKSAIFLSGHSMGSGGTWYIGGKYPDYWTALAPMSGPFVQETGYPWDRVGTIPVFITEGIQTPSLDASRLLRDWMDEQGYNMKYKEVDADHGGMIRLVLPDVFAFFDSCRNESDMVSSRRVGSFQKNVAGIKIQYFHPNRLRIIPPPQPNISNTVMQITDLSGKEYYSSGILLHSRNIIHITPAIPPGVYHLVIKNIRLNFKARFVVIK